MELQELYGQFERRWMLLNPLPQLPVRDRMIFGLQVVVAVGAILLSGSRTGNAVAEIGALAKLGQRIIDLLWFDFQVGSFLVAVEAMLAFATFDAAILLAGFLTGDDQGDKRWYTVLLGAALLPALAANILPGMEHIPSLLGISRSIVDIMIGVCTPFMAYVVGRSIGISTRIRKEKIDALLEAWETAKANSWKTSEEYKAYRAEHVTPLKPKKEAKKKEPDHQNGSKVLEALSNGKELTIDELVEIQGLDPIAGMATILGLEKMGKVLVRGELVTTPDF